MTAAMAARPPRALHLTEALVARVERVEPEGPPRAGLVRMEEADYGPAARALVAARPAGAVWVFAYGSLIWKPAFEAVEARPCHVHGWRRSFCLHLESWRGTVDRPGLMLALDRGGSCHGMAYRMPEDGLEAAMEALLRREIGYVEDIGFLRWIAGRVGGAVVPVLACYAAPRREGTYVRLTEAEQADRLAGAAGHMGSCAAYLHNTVRHLEELGIRDRYLWRLQRMVAERIAAP
ncbi:gamma-glutamylcyclotransferase [Gemmobacter aquarius]|uniref:glutathione-specific gamma-glutamylcyclotransferase n=1 Tax=Paragemmobacter aquarius TaxID=2169400 RepID=A0A2S0UNB7_9RHOB|nr:gamma-glutamylcyclotransferase [Gemmobacter aquarius]AWB49306.1 gamma-glutamylcyclotransferase [Gemmobacter aquarius]